MQNNKRVLLLGLALTIAIADSVDTDILSFKKEYNGRKDRCRHAIRQEISKYSNYVRSLMAKINLLEKDVNQLKDLVKTQKLAMQELEVNLTSQNGLVLRAIEGINSSPRPRWNSSGPPKDCDEVYKNGGMKYPGTYQIQINPTGATGNVPVLCKSANDAGWIVIQQRSDGSVSFKRSWLEYKQGFGELHSEFWLGNRLLHQITNQAVYMLRIELEEFSGRQHWAEYSHFMIDSEENSYKLNISGYSGNAGDSMTDGADSINGALFSAVDRDNDKRAIDSCALRYSAGWWYTSCYYSNLNGRYKTETNAKNPFDIDGVIWYKLDGAKPLKSSLMMIKPVH